MKTTEEKLKAITEDIRSKLPRLKEPMKDCYIDTKTHGICKILYLDLLNEKVKYSVLDEFLDFKEIGKKEIKEIIGKEPTILDCMEWLNKKEYKVELTGQGLLYAVIGKDHPMKKAISCRVDLTKPYLKDQSEEFINFLYGLL